MRSVPPVPVGDDEIGGLSDEYDYSLDRSRGKVLMHLIWAPAREGDRSKEQVMGVGPAHTGRGSGYR